MTGPSMTQPRGRTALEGVRGVVVLTVVAFHAVRLTLTRDGSGWGDVDARWWVTATGRFGVDAFFVLAGYLIVTSWNSCRQRSHSLTAALRDFAERRAWRILPPYLAMLAVLVPLTARQLLDVDRFGDLLQLISVQQYLSMRLPGEVNVPIWSLTTEVHFYMIAPAVAYALRRVAGWQLVTFSAALGLWWLRTPWREDFAASLLPGRLHQFVLGAAAAALLVRHRRETRSALVIALCRPWALTVLLAALLSLGATHGATHRNGISSPLVDLVHPAAGLLLTGLLIRVVAGTPIRVLHNRVLTWVGSISYSLYLWHYPLLDWGLNRWASERSSTLTIVALNMALLAVALLVSYLAHQLIEVPAGRRKERRTSPPNAT